MTNGWIIRKPLQHDKVGNTVQSTYHIGCKETQTYTINAYLTKCREIHR